MKSFINKNKGITLLALIITILVMLILAVVSISAVVGDNGVMTRAQKSQDEQKCATVKDHRDLWWSNLKVANFGENTPVQTLDELVEDLKVNGVITEEDKQEILETGELKFDSIDKSVVFYEVGKKLGKYVKFNNKMWRVLYDDVYTEDSHGLQIICEDVCNETLFRPIDVVVPADFTTAITSITESEENVKKGVYVYDNIVKLLNKLCETLVPNKNYIHSVRSYGTNPIIDQQNDTSEMYYGSDFEVSESMPDGYGLTFVYVLSASREELRNGPIREKRILLRESNTGFSVYKIDENGYFYDMYLGGFYPIPIITLKYGALIGVEGDGTKENPYILK